MVPDGLRLFIDIFGGVAPSKDPWTWDLDGVTELGDRFEKAANSLTELLPEFERVIEQTEEWYEGHGGEQAAHSLKQLTHGKYSIHHLVTAMEAVPEFTSDSNGGIVGDRITESIFAAWGMAEFEMLAAELLASGGLASGFVAAQEALITAIGRYTFAIARKRMMERIGVAAARMLGKQLLLRGLDRMGLEGLEKIVDLAFTGLGSGVKLAGVGAGITAGTQLVSGQDLDLGKIGDAALAWGVGAVAGHTAGRVFGSAARRIGMGRLVPLVTGFLAGEATAVSMAVLHGQWDMYSLGYMGALGATSGARGGLAASRHASVGAVPLDMAGKTELAQLSKQIHADLAVSEGLPTRDFTEKLSVAIAHNDLATMKTLRYQAYTHSVQFQGDRVVDAQARAATESTGTNAEHQSTTEPQSTTQFLSATIPAAPPEPVAAPSTPHATGTGAEPPRSGPATGAATAVPPTVRAGTVAGPDQVTGRAASNGAGTESRAGAAAPERGTGGLEAGTKAEAATPKAGAARGTAAPEAGVKEGTAAPEAGVKDGAAAPEAAVKDGTAAREAGVKDGAAAPEAGVKSEAHEPQSHSESQPGEHTPSRGLRRRIRAFTRAVTERMQSEVALRARMDVLAPEPAGAPERPAAERFREWVAAERARLECVGTEAQARQARKMLDGMVAEFERHEAVVVESDTRHKTAETQAVEEVCSAFGVKVDAVDARGRIKVATEDLMDHYVKVDLVAHVGPRGGLRIDVQLNDFYELNVEAYHAARQPFTEVATEYRDEVRARVGERCADLRTASEQWQRGRRGRTRDLIAQIRAETSVRLRGLHNAAQHDIAQERAKAAAADNRLEAAQQRLGEAEQRLRDAHQASDPVAVTEARTTVRETRTTVAQATAEVRVAVREAGAKVEQLCAELRSKVAAERARAEAAVTAERDKLAEDIGAERAETAKAIAAERIAAIDAVERERVAALESRQRMQELRAAAQRDEAALRARTRERVARLWAQVRETNSPEVRTAARRRIAEEWGLLAAKLKSRREELVRDIAAIRPEFVADVARERVIASELTAAELVKQARVSSADRKTAAEAAGRELVKHFEALSDACAPGMFGITTASREVLTHMLRHGTTMESRMAAAEILRRATASAETPDGKSLRWTQFAAGEAMPHGPANQDAGEGKSMMYHAFVARLAAEKGSVQYLTRDNLVEREFEELVAAWAPHGYKVIRINPDEVMPEPVAGEPTIYIGSVGDVVVSRLRGHPVPGRHAVIDEIDEAFIYANTTYIISEGVREPAPPHVRAQVIAARDFLQQCLRDGTLTHEDFGRTRFQKNGPAWLTEKGREKVEEALGRDMTAEEHHRLNMAASARWEMVRGKHYIVDGDQFTLDGNGRRVTREGGILIIDQVAHRLMMDKAVTNESRWNNGLAQALEARHRLEIRNDSDHSVSLSCAETFTPKNYDLVTGASGTANGVADRLQEHGMGQTTTIDRFASSKLVLEDTTFSVNDLERLRAITAEILAVHETGQPIAVLAHDNNLVRRLTRMLDRHRLEYVKVNAEQILAWEKQGPGIAEAELKKIYAEAGEEGKILVINMQGARGVDITPSTAALTRGGMHVIVTAHSEIRAIDVQAMYRAARSGQPGSASFHSVVTDDLYNNIPVDHEMAVVVERVKTTEDPLEMAVFEQRIRAAIPELQRVAEARMRMLGAAAGNATMVAQGTPAIVGAAAANYLGPVPAPTGAAAAQPATQQPAATQAPVLPEADGRSGAPQNASATSVSGAGGSKRSSGEQAAPDAAPPEAQPTATSVTQPPPDEDLTGVWTLVDPRADAATSDGPSAGTLVDPSADAAASVVDPSADAAPVVGSAPVPVVGPDSEGENSAGESSGSRPDAGAPASTGAQPQPSFADLSEGWAAAQQPATALDSPRMQRLMQKDTQMLQSVRRRYALELQALRKRVMRAGCDPTGMAAAQLAAAYEAWLRPQIEEFLGELQGDLAVPGPLGEGIAGLRAAITQVALRCGFSRAEAMNEGRVASGEILAAELRAGEFAADLAQFEQEVAGVPTAERHAEKLLRRMTQVASAELLAALTDGPAMSLGDGVQLLLEDKVVLLAGARPDLMVQHQLQPWMKARYRAEAKQVAVALDGRVWFRDVAPKPETDADDIDGNVGQPGGVERQRLLATAFAREGVQLEELMVDARAGGQRVAQLWPRLHEREQAVFLADHPGLVMMAEGLAEDVRADACAVWLASARGALAAEQQKDSPEYRVTHPGAPGADSERIATLQGQIEIVENVAAAFAARAADPDAGSNVSESTGLAGSVERVDRSSGQDPAQAPANRERQTRKERSARGESSWKRELAWAIARRGRDNRALLDAALACVNAPVEDLVAAEGGVVVELWEQLEVVEREAFVAAYPGVVMRAEGLAAGVRELACYISLDQRRGALAVLEDPEQIKKVLTQIEDAENLADELAEAPAAEKPLVVAGGDVLQPSAFRPQTQQAPPPPPPSDSDSPWAVPDLVAELKGSAESEAAVGDRPVQDAGGRRGLVLAALRQERPDLLQAEGEVLDACAWRRLTVGLWPRLSADEQDAFVVVLAEVVMAAVGLPVDVRQRAGRIWLDWKQSELVREREKDWPAYRRDHPGSPGTDPTRVATLLVEIDIAEHIAAGLAELVDVADGAAQASLVGQCATHAGHQTRLALWEANGGVGDPPVKPVSTGSPLKGDTLVDVVTSVRADLHVDPDGYESLVALLDRVFEAEDGFTVHGAVIFKDRTGHVFTITRHPRLGTVVVHDMVDGGERVFEGYAEVYAWARGYEKDTLRVVGSEFRDGEAEFSLEPGEDPRNIPAEIADVELFGNPKSWATHTGEGAGAGAIVGFASVGDHEQHGHGQEDSWAFVSVMVNGRPVTAIIVCDGSTSRADGHLASQAAVVAARDRAALELRGIESGDLLDAKALVRSIIDAGQAAVAAIPGEPYMATGRRTPGCTIAVAVLEQGEDGRPGKATVGEVGDSEINAVDRAGNRIRLDPRDAPDNGHIYLAADKGPPKTARYIRTFELPADVVAVVASTDGHDADDIAAAVGDHPDDLRAASVAAADRAAARGHDNSSAVYARVPLIPVALDGKPIVSQHPLPPGNAPLAVVNRRAIAGISHIGRGKDRNEDWMASSEIEIGSRTFRIGVVTDGTSSSTNGHDAARAAAGAAHKYAEEAVRQVVSAAAPGTKIDLEQVVADAIDAAQAAVETLADGKYVDMKRRAAEALADNPNAKTVEPPQCTIAMVIVEPGRGEDEPGQYAAGGVGASRVYKLNTADPAASTLVTRDHVTLPRYVDTGATERRVLEIQTAHVVIHKLGVIHKPGWRAGPPKDRQDKDPYLFSGKVSADDVMLVCTDGDWNYQPEAAGKAAAIAPYRKNLPQAVRVLTDMANRAGGEDNITDLLLDCAPVAFPQPEPASTPTQDGGGIPAALRPGYRMRAAQHNAAVEELQFLADVLGIDVMPLMSDRYRQVLADMPPLTIRDRSRWPVQFDPQDPVQPLATAVRRYHLARNRLRALQDRIAAHGGGVDSVRVRPRPVELPAAMTAMTELFTATERWAAQVPGHPEVTAVGPTGSLMMVGHRGAAHLIVQVVHEESPEPEKALLSAGLAAVDSVAGAEVPAVAMVWRGCDSAELAQDVARLLAARGPLPQTVELVGHDDRADLVSRALREDRADLVRALRDVALSQHRGADLVSRALNDPALAQHDGRIGVTYPDQGVSARVVSHRVECGANNCFFHAGRKVLEVVRVLRQRAGGDVADVEARLRRLRRASASEAGTPGEVAATMLGADWYLREDLTLADLAEHVPEGGVVLLDVEFKGFQVRGVVGTHSVAATKVGGNVTVFDDGQAVPLESWLAGLSDVVAVHMVRYDKYGIAEHPLADGEQPRSVAGRHFALANAGRRLSDERAPPSNRLFGREIDGTAHYFTPEDVQTALVLRADGTPATLVFDSGTNYVADATAWAAARDFTFDREVLQTQQAKSEPQAYDVPWRGKGRPRILRAQSYAGESIALSIDVGTSGKKDIRKIFVGPRTFARAVVGNPYLPELGAPTDLMVMTACGTAHEGKTAAYIFFHYLRRWGALSGYGYSPSGNVTAWSIPRRSGLYVSMTYDSDGNPEPPLVEFGPGDDVAAYSTPDTGVEPEHCVPVALRKLADAGVPVASIPHDRKLAYPETEECVGVPFTELQVDPEDPYAAVTAALETGGHAAVLTVYVEQVPVPGSDGTPLPGRTMPHLEGHLVALNHGELPQDPRQVERVLAVVWDAEHRPVVLPPAVVRPKSPGLLGFRISTPATQVVVGPADGRPTQPPVVLTAPRDAAVRPAGSEPDPEALVREALDQVAVTHVEGDATTTKTNPSAEAVDAPGFVARLAAARSEADETSADVAAYNRSADAQEDRPTTGNGAVPGDSTTQWRCDGLDAHSGVVDPLRGFGSRTPEALVKGAITHAAAGDGREGGGLGSGKRRRATRTTTEPAAVAVPSNAESELEIRELEAELGLETDAQRLLAASLYMEDLFREVAVVAGQPRPERLFGDADWAGFLDAEKYARHYGRDNPDDEFSVAFMLEIHARLLCRTAPEAAGRLQAREVGKAGKRWGTIHEPLTEQELAVIGENPLLAFLPPSEKPPHGGIEYVVYDESEIRARLEAMVGWYKRETSNPEGYDPYYVAASLARKLVSLHPFRQDCNGRAVRIIMNWVLARAGEPPSAIPYFDDDMQVPDAEWVRIVRAGSERYRRWQGELERMGDTADPVLLFGLADAQRRYRELNGAPAPFQPGATHDRVRYRRLHALLTAERSADRDPTLTAVSMSAEVARTTARRVPSRESINMPVLGLFRTKEDQPVRVPGSDGAIVLRSDRESDTPATAVPGRTREDGRRQLTESDATALIRVARRLDPAAVESEAAAIGVAPDAIDALPAPLAVELADRLPVLDVRAVAVAAVAGEIDESAVIPAARRDAALALAVAISYLPDGRPHDYAARSFLASKSRTEIAREFGCEVTELDAIHRWVMRPLVEFLATEFPAAGRPLEVLEAALDLDRAKVEGLIGQLRLAGADHLRKRYLDTPPMSIAEIAAARNMPWNSVAHEMHIAAFRVVRELSAVESSLGGKVVAAVRRARDENPWELAVGLRKLAERSRLQAQCVERRVLWGPSLPAATAAAMAGLTEREFSRQLNRGLSWLARFLSSARPLQGKNLMLVEDAQDYYPEQLRGVFAKMREQHPDQWRCIELRLLRDSPMTIAEMAAEVGIPVPTFNTRLRAALRRTVALLSAELGVVEHDFTVAAQRISDGDPAAAAFEYRDSHPVRRVCAPLVQGVAVAAAGANAAGMHAESPEDPTIALAGLSGRRFAAGLNSHWDPEPFPAGAAGLAALVEQVRDPDNDIGLIAAALEVGADFAHAIAVVRVNAALAAEYPELAAPELRGTVVVFDDAYDETVNGWIVGDRAVNRWRRRAGRGVRRVHRLTFDDEIRPKPGPGGKPAANIGPRMPLGARDNRPDDDAAEPADRWSALYEDRVRQRVVRVVDNPQRVDSRQRVSNRRLVGELVAEVLRRVRAEADDLPDGPGAVARVDAITGNVLAEFAEFAMFLRFRRAVAAAVPDDAGRRALRGASDAEFRQALSGLRPSRRQAVELVFGAKDTRWTAFDKNDRRWRAAVTSSAKAMMLSPALVEEEVRDGIRGLVSFLAGDDVESASDLLDIAGAQAGDTAAVTDLRAAYGREFTELMRVVAPDARRVRWLVDEAFRRILTSPRPADAHPGEWIRALAGDVRDEYRDSVALLAGADSRAEAAELVRWAQHHAVEALVDGIRGLPDAVLGDADPLLDANDGVDADYHRAVLECAQLLRVRLGANRIREFQWVRLDSGRLPWISQQHVADAVRVHQTTVSAVFRASRSVRANIGMRVRAAAALLGYLPELWQARVEVDGDVLGAFERMYSAVGDLRWARWLTDQAFQQAAGAGLGRDAVGWDAAVDRVLAKHRGAVAAATDAAAVIRWALRDHAEVLRECIDGLPAALLAKLAHADDPYAVVECGRLVRARLGEQRTAAVPADFSITQREIARVMGISQSAAGKALSEHPEEMRTGSKVNVRTRRRARAVARLVGFYSPSHPAIARPPRGRSDAGSALPLDADVLDWLADLSEWLRALRADDAGQLATTSLVAGAQAGNATALSLLREVLDRICGEPMSAAAPDPRRARWLVDEVLRRILVDEMPAETDAGEWIRAQAGDVRDEYRDSVALLADPDSRAEAAELVRWAQRNAIEALADSVRGLPDAVLADADHDVDAGHDRAVLECAQLLRVRLGVHWSETDSGSAEPVSQRHVARAARMSPATVSPALRGKVGEASARSMARARAAADLLDYRLPGDGLEARRAAKWIVWAQRNDVPALADSIAELPEDVLTRADRARAVVACARLLRARLAAQGFHQFDVLPKDSGHAAPISQEQVARAAGRHPNTVAAALAAASGNPEHLRVRAAAELLGYLPTPWQPWIGVDREVMDLFERMHAETGEVRWARWLTDEAFRQGAAAGNWAVVADRVLAEHRDTVAAAIDATATIDWACHHHLEVLRECIAELPAALLAGLARADDPRATIRCARLLRDRLGERPTALDRTEPPVTDRGIARVLGLSRTTVGKAMDDHGTARNWDNKVGAETVTRVRAAARLLGYRPLPVRPGTPMRPAPTTGTGDESTLLLDPDVLEWLRARSARPRGGGRPERGRAGHDPEAFWEPVDEQAALGLSSRRRRSGRWYGPEVVFADTPWEPPDAGVSAKDSAPGPAGPPSEPRRVAARDDYPAPHDTEIETENPDDLARDLALVAAVKAGDRTAYDELYRLYYGLLKGMAMRLTRSRDDAEDLVSDTFATALARLLRAGDDFPIRNFGGFLLTRMRFIFYDSVARAAREPATDLDSLEKAKEGDLEFLNLGRPTVVPGDAAPMDDEVSDESAIGRAFASLPDELRIVLQLIQIEGYSPEEAGQRLGLSTDVVNARFERARAALQAAFVREQGPGWALAAALTAHGAELGHALAAGGDRYATFDGLSAAEVATVSAARIERLDELRTVVEHVLGGRREYFVRWFMGQSLADVAVAMNCSENVAQQRVSTAVHWVSWWLAGTAGDELMWRIKLLPEVDRRVAGMLLMRGRSIADVAVELKWRESAVHTHRDRVVQQLAMVLSGGAVLSDAEAVELFAAARILDPGLVDGCRPYLSTEYLDSIDRLLPPGKSVLQLERETGLGRNIIRGRQCAAARAVVELLPPEIRAQCTVLSVRRRTLVADLARATKVGASTVEGVLRGDSAMPLNAVLRVLAAVDRIGMRHRCAKVGVDGYWFEPAAVVAAAPPDELARCIELLSEHDRRVATAALAESAPSEVVLAYDRRRIAGQLVMLLSGGMVLSDAEAVALFDTVRLHRPNVVARFRPQLSESQRDSLDRLFPPGKSVLALAAEMGIGREMIRFRRYAVAHVVAHMLPPELRASLARLSVLRRATVDDLARAARVNPFTVEAMFRGDPTVRRDKAARVLKAVDRLGFADRCREIGADRHWFDPPPVESTLQERIWQLVTTAGRDELERWIRELCDIDRKIATLHLRRKVSVADTAALLGADDKAVATRLRRIVSQLATVLSGGTVLTDVEAVAMFETIRDDDPDLIRSCLPRLAERHRDSVDRLFPPGKSVGQTAIETDLAESTVQFRRYAAAHGLVESLSPELREHYARLSVRNRAASADAAGFRLGGDPDRPRGKRTAASPRSGGTQLTDKDVMAIVRAACDQGSDVAPGYLLLSETQRKYFDLYFTRGIALDDIAFARDLSRSAVSEQIRRIAQCLAARLSEFANPDIAAIDAQLRNLPPDWSAADLAQVVRTAIDDGALRPGQRLPSNRSLARYLGSTVMVVKRVYVQLAAEGYLVLRQGFGTTVASPESGTVESAVRTAVVRIIREESVSGELLRPRGAVLVAALRAAIESGAPPVGERLPSVTDLAEQLGVSVDTAYRAYARLADEGYVEIRHTFGTVVVSNIPRRPV
ncbi:sigma-70 family RNA polymerase sigma factor [Nocardia sp. 2YAB30]|uniref:sigma-70 family RNA polymerase sigma factor n=1 Tax=Nocardia sp. 2YAB30 TaxID=3233022 RepID=UPI003F9A1D8F